jgi:hypothetical protein
MFILNFKDKGVTNESKKIPRSDEERGERGKGEEENGEVHTLWYG